MLLSAHFPVMSPETVFSIRPHSPDLPLPALLLLLTHRAILSIYNSADHPLYPSLSYPLLNRQWLLAPPPSSILKLQGKTNYEEWRNAVQVVCEMNGLCQERLGVLK